VPSTRLFHIASAGAWDAAVALGVYGTEFVAAEGFIHCSDAHQVAWVANRRFRGRQDLVLLHIEFDRLDAPVRYENLEGGHELFPHVYGAIPLSAIVDVTPFRPALDGSFSA
jgi:uncharacterized protein (DUF952 family)